MKPRLALTTLFLAVTSLTAHGQFTSGQPAQSVLGQPNLSTSAVGAGTTGLNGARRVTVDRISGAVYVADTENHRVLRYSDTDAQTSGAAAELVLGQPNFATTTSGTGAAKMNTPTGLFINDAGQLWVADRNNHRVLRFDNARSAVNGANADGVLGQENFDSNVFATSQSGMRFPGGVALQTTGTLFVADSGNDRVVFFDGAAALAAGSNADGVLGQIDFVSSSFGTSSAAFFGPSDVAVNGSGTLLVADSGNNRILRFDLASGKANGAAADGVLGQPDFDTGNPGLSASEFSNPVALSLSQFGALYIADNANNRVLKIDNAANESGEIDANLVLGQPNSTTNTVANADSALNGPTGVVISPFTSVFVAQRAVNRVSRFGIFTPSPDPTPIPADTTKPKLKVKGRRSVDSSRNRVVFRGTATDGSAIVGVEFKVSGQRGFRSARGTNRWKAVVRPDKNKRKTVVRVRAVDASGNKSRFLKLKIFRR